MIRFEEKELQQQFLIEELQTERDLSSSIQKNLREGASHSPGLAESFAHWIRH